MSIRLVIQISNKLCSTNFLVEPKMRRKVFAEVFLSGSQMGYDMGLGGWLLTGSKLFCCFFLVISMCLCSTCLPTYQCAFVHNVQFIILLIAKLST